MRVEAASCSSDLRVKVSMVMAVVRMRQCSLPCARVWFGKMSNKLMHKLNDMSFG